MVENPSPKRAAVQASVLAATEELLAEGASFPDLGIERIATRAGISRTAFYFYFKDKQELLTQLTQELSDELYRQADIWFSGGEDPRQEMHDALTAVWGVYRGHGPLVRAVVEASATDPGIASFWRALLGRFVDATAARLEQENPGPTALGPAHPTAFALTWMVERAFYEQLVQGEPYPPQDLVDGMTGIFMRTVYGAA
jgi:TetR/AcrR family transcriptional regulator, ethionamide resistance regulator